MIKNSFARSCLLITAAVTLAACQQQPATTTPSVKPQDYLRAAQWQRPNVAKLVKNIYVIPHWVGGTDQFWYRNETAGGYEFLLVNGKTGVKQPLFDHFGLAKLLTQAGLKNIDVDALPLEAVEIDATLNALDFQIEQQQFHCKVAPLYCDITKVKKTAGNILTSPDGKRGVYSRDNNLWLIDFASGEEYAFTRDGIDDFGYGIHHDTWEAMYIKRSDNDLALPPLATEWSPDGAKILVSRIDQRHVKPYPFVSTAPDDGSFRPKLYQPRIAILGERPATIEWFIIDVNRGDTVRVELPYDKLLDVHQDLLPILKTWWRGDRLYVTTYGKDINAAYLFEINPANGAVRTLIEERIAPRTEMNSSTYNPPNVEMVANSETGHDEIIWFSQRSGWGHLYRYDAVTGELLNPVTSGDWLVRDIIQIDAENQRIFFTGAAREGGNPYYRYLYRVNFDGSNLTLLSPEPADHLLIGGKPLISFDGAKPYQAVSPSGELVVYNYSTINQPTKTVITRVADGAPLHIFNRADAGALYQAGWRDPEEFTAKAADGITDLYGVIYKPPGFDPHHKYPVIDSQYASPLTAVTPRNFYMAIMSLPGVARTASLTEFGFVCVVVDARGTSYRSRDFIHYSYRNLNTNGLEDHVAAIKQLGERFSWLDMERIGIQGKSYGGYSTIRALLEFPDFFKAGVSSAGLSNWFPMQPDYHFTAYQGQPLYEDGGNLRPAPNAKALNYLSSDANIQVDNLRGDLLLVVGELDENVLSTTNMQLAKALINADKDFDMLYIPTMNHSLRNDYSIRYVLNFFIEHLAPRK